jgi:glucose-6-phosphate isomerase
LDAELFCKGAERVVKDFFAEENSYPISGAALALTAMQSGFSISVFMPYFEALKPFSSWICQIWAESLGKSGNGSTPLKVVGTLDQHSQLQLYLDGPRDKIFNIIAVHGKKFGPIINSRFTAMEGLSDVEGKTIGELNIAALGGTAATLAENSRPIRMFTLDKLGEESLGALMMHFSLETILTAQVLEINAFDQPAVEEGKILARKMLAKKG